MPLRLTPIKHETEPLHEHSLESLGDPASIIKASGEGTRPRKRKVPAPGLDDAEVCDNNTNDTKQEEGHEKEKRPRRKNEGGSHAPEFKPTLEQDDFIISLVQRHGTTWGKVADEYNKRYGVNMLHMKNRWHHKLKQIVAKNNNAVDNNSNNTTVTTNNDASG
ncbi:hypothetical protein DFJ77DRAFT_276403 [Powellomyces hirtus]|nr:hypothetical protein DFJ77DRAFT_276403 [Powellomyces hirtus]